MRIVIDLQGAQTSGSRNRGIGRYTTSLTEAILRNRNGHDVHLALNGSFPASVSEIRQRFSALIPQNNIHVWQQLPSVAHNVAGSSARRIASENLREYFIRDLHPDVIHISSLFEGLADDGLCSIGKLYSDIPTSVTAYDLIPLINRREYLTDLSVTGWYMDRIDHLRRADAFLAISDSAREEVIKYVGAPADACVNVGTAADPHFSIRKISEAREAAIRRKFGLSNAFVMYTGGIDVRKNIERLIAAYARLPKSLRAHHQLAIVCSAHEQDRERLIQLGESKGLAEGELVMTGFVSEKDLVLLYNLTRLFVFPSWHEGFGLPALEAMQCGAPVIASNRSSLPEVIGTPEAMFDPFDERAMRDLIRKGLEDGDYRARLLDNAKRQVRLFDWDQCAKRAVAAFERMHQSRTLRAPSLDHRPRLAYVAPLPPARTGIADYSAELLPELSKHYRIEVVVKDETVRDVDFPLALRAIPVITASEFQQKWSNYDRILYHFGNSDQHDYMFPLLEQTSGVVVLHDFYLSGIVSYREWHNQQPHGWSDELYRSHGYSALLNRRDAKDVYDTVWKYPCSRSVIEQASTVIVHSRNSVDLARRWYGERVARKLHRIPHLRTAAAPTADKAAVRKDLGFAPDDLLVCAFGMIGPTKLNHELAKAWLSSSLADDPKCKLIFVGQNDPGNYGAELQELITGSPNKRISITGWTDAELFQNYLTIADIGVQLRTLSRGETSGTVLDCMNHGVPLIINNNGGMADLAGDAAIILKDDFEVGELTQALEALAGNAARRSELGANGVRTILLEHAPSACAEAYWRTIEASSAEDRLISRMLESTRRVRLSEFEAAQFSSALAAITVDVLPRMFVDVTALARTDAGTGIQRVVRNVLARLLATDFQGFRVEPVFVDPEAAGFRFARTFSAAFLNVELGLDDDIVDFTERDVLLLLDLNPVLLKFVKDEIARLKLRGVQVNSVVYDLLPIKHPELFPDDAEDVHRDWLQIVASGTAAVCISEAVAGDLRNYLEQNHPGSTLRVAHFPLGSELDGEVRMQQRRKGKRGRPASPARFLMVGTIEPRKGYLGALDSFEQLWADGEDVELWIVGKQGWKSADIVRRLEDLAASRPLTWHGSISDAELEKLYRTANCLVAASVDEGFGLPLVEAAYRGMQLIVRDIPVFREVCRDGAIYFSGNLTEVLRTWVHDYRSGNAGEREGIPHITWEESVHALLRSILPETRLGIRN